LATIQEEQAAFDALLPSLLEKHRGEFALFKDGHVVSFHESNESAYAAGIGLFGPDAVFLVAAVIEPRLRPVSFAWDAGVMFG
jgi:hypothetical protein